MNLDGACRGSIVFYEGKKYVITGKDYIGSYLAVEVVNADELLIAGRFVFNPNGEVDLCFPGEVFPVPKFIK